jgi:arylsulfatase
VFKYGRVGNVLRGNYSKNWEVPAKARLKRQQALGLFGNNVVGAPPEESQKYSLLIDSNDVNWDTVDGLDHQMAVYAAVVWRLDRSVGSLVDSLQELGVFNDTLIMFFSDNGPEYAMGGTTGKTTGYPTVSGSFWSYARGWSSLSSAPFRKWKMKTHQGGIASHLIVHWPSGISRRGWVRGVHHIIDIFPTLLAVAGENPADFPQLEGASFFPSLVDGGHGCLPPKRSIRVLFWKHYSSSAVRVGDLKAVMDKDGAELFDLAADPRRDFHER